MYMQIFVYIHIYKYIHIYIYISYIYTHIFTYVSYVYDLYLYKTKQNRSFLMVTCDLALYYTHIWNYKIVNRFPRPKPIFSLIIA